VSCSRFAFHRLATCRKNKLATAVIGIKTLTYSGPMSLVDRQSCRIGDHRSKLTSRWRSGARATRGTSQPTWWPVAPLMLRKVESVELYTHSSGVTAGGDNPRNFENPRVTCRPTPHQRVVSVKEGPPPRL